MVFCNLRSHAEANTEILGINARRLWLSLHVISLTGELQLSSTCMSVRLAALARRLSANRAGQTWGEPVRTLGRLGAYPNPAEIRFAHHSHQRVLRGRNSKSISDYLVKKLVLPSGIEPPTSPLPRVCSTTELRQQDQERFEPLGCVAWTGRLLPQVLDKRKPQFPTSRGLTTKLF